jgi:hypothetical protein
LSLDRQIALHHRLGDTRLLITHTLAVFVALPGIPACPADAVSQAGNLDLRYLFTNKTTITINFEQQLDFESR